MFREDDHRMLGLRCQTTDTHYDLLRGELGLEENCRLFAHYVGLTILVDSQARKMNQRSHSTDQEAEAEATQDLSDQHKE